MMYRLEWYYKKIGDTNWTSFSPIYETFEIEKKRYEDCFYGLINVINFNLNFKIKEEFDDLESERYFFVKIIERNELGSEQEVYYAQATVVTKNYNTKVLEVKLHAIDIISQLFTNCWIDWDQNNVKEKTVAIYTNRTGNYNYDARIGGVRLEEMIRFGLDYMKLQNDLYDYDNILIDRDFEDYFENIVVYPAFGGKTVEQIKNECIGFTCFGSNYDFPLGEILKLATHVFGLAMWYSGNSIYLRMYWQLSDSPQSLNNILFLGLEPYKIINLPKTEVIELDNTKIRINNLLTEGLDSSVSVNMYEAIQNESDEIENILFYIRDVGFAPISRNDEYVNGDIDGNYQFDNFSYASGVYSMSFSGSKTAKCHLPNIVLSKGQKFQYAVQITISGSFSGGTISLVDYSRDSSYTKTLSAGTNTYTFDVNAWETFFYAIELEVSGTNVSVDIQKNVHYMTLYEKYTNDKKLSDYFADGNRIFNVVPNPLINYASSNYSMLWPIYQLDALRKPDMLLSNYEPVVQDENFNKYIVDSVIRKYKNNIGYIDKLKLLKIQ